MQVLKLMLEKLTSNNEEQIKHNNAFAGFLKSIIEKSVNQKLIDNNPLQNCDSINELYQIFNVGVSQYWETHYNFDKESSKKMKRLSKSFVDLLVINTIIPLKFAYARSQQKEITQELIDLAITIPSEKNAIIEKFELFGIRSKNVYESQALLELKKNYCDYKKCLDCAVGHFILKK